MLKTESELEYPLCPLCHSENREVRYTGFGTHEVVRCGQCAMHYLYPRLTEAAMRQFYEQDDYFEGGESGYSDTSYSDQEAALRATFKRLMLNLKKRNLTGGSLLEVGCGYGFLLAEAEGFFKNRVGTEFSPEGVRQSSKKADAVYEGGIEQLPDDARFDCVLATHVIEHVYEPLEFIKKLVAHVKPGGTIVLAAPDMGGMLRKAMGRRWASFKVPEHVLYFDADTLSSVMRDAGLTGLQVLPYPHAFPLGLITSKLRLPSPAAIRKLNIWVPATTIAVYGKVKDEQS